MNIKKISTISILAIASTFAVGCSKDDNKKEPQVQQEAPKKEEKKEEIKKVPINKMTFKDLNELRTFMKSTASDFGKFLGANKIETLIAPDGSLVINKESTYEKYTKNFNQLAYSHVSVDYANATGYLKTGIKLNAHMEEKLTTANTYIQAMFKIISKHNPAITEEAFNKYLADSTGNSKDISDSSFDTGINGLTVNTYSKPDDNEREIVLSIRQDLEIPKTSEILKEYKTVQEFKEDSLKLSEDLNVKVQRMNEILKNAYIGKAKDIKVNLKSFDSSDTQLFSQNLELDYNSVETIVIPDELITGVYEIIESIVTKEKLSKIISLDEFKSYMKSLELYGGVYEGIPLADETGEPILPNSLPFLKEVNLSIRFEPVAQEQISDNTNSPAVSANNTPKATVKKYNNFMNIKISVPVKAEGVTSL